MSNEKDAAWWIDELGLIEHPEGGYFRETYRSDEALGSQQLPDRYESPRNVATSIYFMLTTAKVSNFHRLNSDEIWYYHAGGTARIHIINPEGDYSYQDIGPEPGASQSFQVIIPRHSWFAAEVIEADYVLVGCGVAPGFDFVDFELADYKALSEHFPQHQSLIKRFTNQ